MGKFRILRNLLSNTVTGMVASIILKIDTPHQTIQWFLFYNMHPKSACTGRFRTPLMGVGIKGFFRNLKNMTSFLYNLPLPCCLSSYYPKQALNLKTYCV